MAHYTHTNTHIHHMYTGPIPLLFLSEPQGTKELAVQSQAWRVAEHSRRGRAHQALLLTHSDPALPVFLQDWLASVLLGHLQESSLMFHAKASTL